MAFRLQYIRCGKKRCHCMRGSIGHGPYWYEFWREGERTRSRYVGKHRQDARADRHYRKARDPRERFRFDGRMTERAALRILGFDSRPSIDELKARWRRLVAEHHPDIGGDAAVCAAISAAYAWMKQ